MLRFQRPWLPPVEEVATYFAAAERRRWYSNGGPCFEQLVSVTEERLGVGNVPVANCTLGLVLALRAVAERMGTADRQFVIQPSYTFAATTCAVVEAGFEPLYVDVDEASAQVDPDSLAAAIERFGHRSAAILLTSTFGTPPAAEFLDRYRSLAVAASLPVVFDSAAAFPPLDLDHRPRPSLGDAEVFSMHATKPFAIGEGGVICSHDSEVLSVARQLMNFGFDAERHPVRRFGTNAKMSEWHAATALAVWKHIDDILTIRRSQCGYLRSISDPTLLGFPEASELSTGQALFGFASSPERRADLDRRGDELGVEVMHYFDSPLHRSRAFGSYPSVGTMRASVDLARRAVSFPMANDLDLGELALVGALVSGRPREDLTEELRTREITWWASP